VLRDEVLAKRLLGGGSAEAMARDLVTAALQAGSRDNVTAVVVKLAPGD
jgi:serine/threonine protein phosphatase PrpC